MDVPNDDELDRLVLKHLKNLSEILELMQHLEDSLSLGRLLLAKTRHNLSGNSCSVSSTSYNMQAMSTRGATTRALVTDEIFNLFGDYDTHATHFQLIDELAEDRLKSDTHADPIRWFSGVLVPASLRRAQTCFRRAIDLSLDLACRRAKLIITSRELKRLITLKLENDKPDLIDVSIPEQCKPMKSLP